MTTFPQAPPPGLTVGGYQLRARLGEGGMGVVHLGQRRGERPVALKVLRPHIVGDDEARRRLAREVASLGRVRSRRIAEIVDADPWGEIPYVATRYVPGLSLHDHVAAEGPISGDDLVWFADCLAEALEAVHSAGVLHRDVKPTNVVMEGRSPVLIDFGLARVADDPRLTMTGWLLGTPGYLAPEILHGEDATPASDVHAWAATVAFAGLGRAPFGRGPAMAVMDRVRRGEHDLGGLDPRLLTLVDRALSPDPERRPSLRQVRDRLTQVAGGGSSRPMPEAAAVTAPMVTAPMATMPYAASLHHESAAPTEVTGHPDPSRPDPSHPDPLDCDSSHDATAAQPDWHDDLEVDSRTPWSERLRSRLLLLGVAGAVGAAGRVAPWVTVAAVAVAVWLLRSGSTAASRIGDRRRLRGVRWYDGPQLLLAAPWHLVATVPGSLVLVGWSLGVAAAAALCCFAASLSMSTSLLVVGAAFAVAVWAGPGSGRVRSPVHRVVDPLSRRWVPWLLAAALSAAAVAGLLELASVSGTSWTPFDGAPFAGVRLPSWL